MRGVRVVEDGHGCRIRLEPLKVMISDLFRGVHHAKQGS